MAQNIHDHSHSALGELIRTGATLKWRLLKTSEADATLRTREHVSDLLGAAGTPLCWSEKTSPGGATGNTTHLALMFEPALPAAAFVRCLITVGPADLVVGSDVLTTLPDLFVGAVIEAAAAKLLRQKRRVG